MEQPFAKRLRCARSAVPGCLVAAVLLWACGPTAAQEANTEMPPPASDVEKVAAAIASVYRDSLVALKGEIGKTITSQEEALVALARVSVANAAMMARVVARVAIFGLTPERIAAAYASPDFAEAVSAALDPITAEHMPGILAATGGDKLPSLADTPEGCTKLAALIGAWIDECGDPATLAQLFTGAPLCDDNVNGSGGATPAAPPNDYTEACAARGVLWAEAALEERRRRVGIPKEDRAAQGTIRIGALTYFKNDLDGAVKEAAAGRRPLFVAFHGVMCANSGYMEKKILPSAEVANLLEGFVRVVLYADQEGPAFDRIREEQLRLAGSREIPSYVVMEAATGAVIGKRLGMVMEKEKPVFVEMLAGAAGPR